MAEILSPNPKQRAPFSPTKSPFFIGSNDDKLERAQAHAAAIRRKPAFTTTSASYEADPCLGKDQLLELFQNCIKLAIENKINQKNTWELNLIDHLCEIIKVEEENDAETNFQKEDLTQLMMQLERIVGNNINISLSELRSCIWGFKYFSLGVVYGDLGISPLYVYRSTFAEDIVHPETNEEIYGVLSLVFCTVTLVPLLKYVFIVLRANDNGEGGTFALYSLLCRYAKVNSLPSCQLADGELSSYNSRTIDFWSKAKIELGKISSVAKFFAFIGFALNGDWSWYINYSNFGFFCGFWC